MLVKTQGMVLLSSTYMLGILAYTNNCVLPAVCILFCLALFLFLKNKITIIVSLMLFLLFSFACFNCSMQLKTTDRLVDYVSSSVKLQGFVTSIPTTDKADRTKFYLNVRGVNDSTLRAKTIVTVKDDNQSYKLIEVGDEIAFNGALFPVMQASNPRQFDYSKYLEHKGVFTTFHVKDKKFELVSKPKTGWWRFLQLTNRYRSKIMAVHSSCLTSPNLELLGGMVFGDDAVNPPDYIKDSFRASGLLHILAASGLNVALIFGIWMFFAFRFRLPHRFGLSVGAVLICIYTCMTGFGASILRASLMLLFILLGKFIDRQANTTALLFFVGMLLLVFNPAMIYEVGFQLSFVVTLGLILTVQPLSEKIQHKCFPDLLKGVILVPLVAQLWVSPILMCYFNTFSVYSVFANILSLPLLTVVSFGGFIGSIAALVPKFGVQLCACIDFVLNYFLSGLVNISNLFSNLPHSILTTFSPSLRQIAMFYLVLIAFVLLLRLGFKNRPVVVSFVIVVVLFCISLVPIQNNKLEIIFFDVKNADACLIKTPQNKYYLIDTGKQSYSSKYSQAKSIIGKYLSDKGIRSLDAVIVTHFDSDHAGGVVDIMNNFNVKLLVIPKPVVKTELVDAIFKHIEAKKQAVLYAPNDVIIFEENELALKTFLAKHGDENDKSVIALLSYKDVNALFMGDAGYKSFGEIQNCLPPAVQLVKVGHHGAVGSVSENMLERLNPSYALISTGYNTFGHPDIDVIRLLYSKNIKAYRTDILNAIKFESDGFSLSPSFYNRIAKDFEFFR